MLLMVAVLALLTGAASQAGPPALQQVRTDVDGGGVTLTFTASGAVVPTPVKLLEEPFRLYFDLPGVRPGAERRWSVGDGVVRQVRAALNQRDPIVTRVVIDLADRASWKIEPGGSPREFRITVTPAGLPRADAGAGAGGAPEATPDRSAHIALGLDALAPTLEAIRAGDGPSDAALTVLLARAEALAAAARALRGPDTAHDALLRATADAVLSAARARAAAVASSDAQAHANAVSAAAGAILLIDRLKTETAPVYTWTRSSTRSNSDRTVP